MASTHFTTGTTITSEWLNDVNDAVYEGNITAEGVQYTPPFTGGVTETVEAKLAQTVSVKDFGAVGDGVTDDTDFIQNAIDAVGANGGGSLYFPAGTYRIEGTLNVTENGTSLQGDSKKSTVLLFANGADDCITAIGASYANQISGFEIHDMEFQFDGKTGGRTLVMKYAYRSSITNVSIEGCYTGFEIYANNDAYLENIIFQLIDGGSGTNFGCEGNVAQKPTACYGIFWHGAADGTAQAIQLTTFNVTVTCGYTGADGLIWDGGASTWNMNQTTVLNSRYGLWVKNSQLSNAHYPTFLNATNFCTDGVSAVGARFDAGAIFQLTNCAITNTSGSTGQGSADTHALVIYADTGNSYTREFYFSNCRIGYSKQIAAWVSGRNIIFSNCNFISGATTPSNTYPAIQVVGTADYVNITGCMTSVYGATNDWKYGVQVDDGATNVSVVGNSFGTNQTKAILWNADDAASQDFGNITGSTGLVDPAPQTNPSSDTVTTGYTISASKLLGGIYEAVGTPSAPFTAVTATAAQLVAAVQSPQIGKGVQVMVINATNSTMTISGGSGVSLSGVLSGGNFVMTTGTSRVFIVRFNNVTAGSESVSIYG